MIPLAVTRKKIFTILNSTHRRCLIPRLHRPTSPSRYSSFLFLHLFYLTTTASSLIPSITAKRTFTAVTATAAFKTTSATTRTMSSSSIQETTTTTTTVRPNPPFQYKPAVSSTTTSDDAGGTKFNLNDLSTKIVESEEKRQNAYELSRQFQVKLVEFKHHIKHNAFLDENYEQTTTQMLDDLQHNYANKVCNSENGDESSDAATTTNNNRTPRLANLSYRMEDYVRCLAYHHFLQTGRLLAPSAIVDATATTIITDEEYLGGACMGLAQDLQRYALGRATSRDSTSVQMACNLVYDINEYLLGLDFRNGPLRRKYDGTKYALKGLETLLYELAVTSGSGDINDEQGPPQSKRQKRDASSSLIPVDELKALQDRMVRRDELRESLIKKCRDGQKAAKQSIFALHRGDKKRALDLIKQCHSCIVNQLLPISEQEPPLRSSGSLMGVIEEYVEAKLFASWLYGANYDDNNSEEGGDSPTKPVGIVLKPDDFDIDLQVEEYIGGLCDLTGEIGRYAVQRGTARDVDGVTLCLSTNSQIWYALQTMERLPSGAGKKMDPLQRSVEKLERMLYEMSLSEAAGGRNVQTEIGDVTTTTGGDDQQ